MYTKFLKISLAYILLAFSNVYASNNNNNENELFQKSTNLVKNLRESGNENLIVTALISWGNNLNWKTLPKEDFKILATIIIEVAKEKGTLERNKTLLFKIAERYNFSKEILNESSIEHDNFIEKNKEYILRKNENILNINFESSQIQQKDVFKNVKSDIKKLILCGGKKNEFQDLTDESWLTVDFSEKIQPDLVLDLTQQASYKTLLKEGQYDLIFEEYGWAPARHVILKNVKYLLGDKGVYVGLFCLPFERDENKKRIDFNQVWLLINNLKDKAEKGTLDLIRDDMFKKQRDFVLKIGGQKGNDSLFKKISESINEAENNMNKEATIFDMPSKEESFHLKIDKNNC